MGGVKLDVIDQKILAVLLKNARISTTELARVVGNNYPTVYSHLTNLIQKGVIIHSFPHLQIQGLGVRIGVSVYLKLKDIAPEDKTKLIEEIIKNPTTMQIYELEGEWDIFIWMADKGFKELRNSLDAIKILCNKHIDSILTMIPVIDTYLNAQFFLPKKIDIDYNKIISGYRKHTNKITIVPVWKGVDLNKFDLKILDFIKTNANASLEEIGKHAGIEPALVDYRIKKYIKSTLIMYFGIEVDPAILGYSQYLLCLNLNGNTEAKISFTEYLKGINAAYHYQENIGYWEFSIVFCVKTREEIEHIKNEIISKYKNILQDYRIIWIKKRHKMVPYPDAEYLYLKERLR